MSSLPNLADERQQQTTRKTSDATKKVFSWVRKENPARKEFYFLENRDAVERGAAKKMF